MVKMEKIARHFQITKKVRTNWINRGKGPSESWKISKIKREMNRKVVAEPEQNFRIRQLIKIEV